MELMKTCEAESKAFELVEKAGRLMSAISLVAQTPTG
jgi:hypothetical protein